MSDQNSNNFRGLKRLIFNHIDRANRAHVFTSPEQIYSSRIRFMTQFAAPHFKPHIPSSGIGVDLGAGDGLFSKLFSSPLRKIYRVDLDLPDVSVSNFIQSSAESLPFDNDSVDLVTAFYAFHHFENKEKSFAEAFRILRPGGIFVGHMEFPRYAFQNFFLYLNEISMNSIAHGNAEPTRPSYFTKNDFESLLRDNASEIKVCYEFPKKIISQKLFKSKKVLYVAKK